MMARTHLAFGLLAGLFVLPFVSLANLNKYLFVGIVLLSALFPDIDHPSSIINRKLHITKVIPLLARHRGLFHSIWIPLAVHILLWLSGYGTYAIAITTGYIAHLLSDSLTKDGINFLWPVAQLKVAGFIETGGLMEVLVFFLVLGVIVAKMVI